LHSSNRSFSVFQTTIQTVDVREEEEKTSRKHLDEH